MALVSIPTSADIYIEVNGTKVDPLPWLRENAGRYSY